MVTANVHKLPQLHIAPVSVVRARATHITGLPSWCRHTQDLQTSPCILLQSTVMQVKSSLELKPQNQPWGKGLLVSSFCSQWHARRPICTPPLTRNRSSHGALAKPPAPMAMLWSSSAEPKSLVAKPAQCIMFPDISLHVSCQTAASSRRCQSFQFQMIILFFNNALHAGGKW